MSAGFGKVEGKGRGGEVFGEVFGWRGGEEIAVCGCGQLVG